MFKAPIPDKKTLEFREINKERYEELKVLNIQAEEGKFPLDEYRNLASVYNKDLVSFGGQQGFGFALLEEK